jgi:hypothetical protein
MNDTDFDAIASSGVQNRASQGGSVRIVIEGAPSDAETIRSLASLLLGSTVEGSEQLARRLQAWQAESEGRGEVLFPESPDESEAERLRFALVGLASMAPAVGASLLSSAFHATDSIYVRFSDFLSPVTNSRMMRPLQRRYDGLAARGQGIFESWIDSGRRAEQRSRALARQAAFEGTDEAIDEMVGLLAQKPEVRELVTAQTLGMAEEVVTVVRERTANADSRWERRVRRLFRLG